MNLFQKVIATLSASAGFLSAMSLAQIKYDPPQQKQVVVEYKSLVQLSRVAQPVPFAFVEKDAAKYDTPENALIAMVSAMHRGDYTAWLAGWTQQSRAQIEKTNADSKLTPETWINGWKRLVTGKQIAISARGDYIRRGETYAFIRYRTIGSQAPNGGPLEQYLVFQRKGNQWEATNMLADDLVQIHFLQIAASTDNRIVIERGAN
jgi:hypothetical protein